MACAGASLFPLRLRVGGVLVSRAARSKQIALFRLYSTYYCDGPTTGGPGRLQCEETRRLAASHFFAAVLWPISNSLGLRRRN